MDENTRLFISFVVFCVVVFLMRYFGVKDQKHPLEEVPCKVLSKREETVRLATGKGVQYFVVFEKVPSGHQFEVMILMTDAYRKLNIGDEGIVYLRNSLFVKFEKTNLDNLN